MIPRRSASISIYPRSVDTNRDNGGLAMTGWEIVGLLVLLIWIGGSWLKDYWRYRRDLDKYEHGKWRSYFEGDGINPPRPDSPEAAGFNWDKWWSRPRECASPPPGRGAKRAPESSVRPRR